jgi:hypothetical protein
MRELAGRDFETALALAGALDDKYQRALAVLSLASRCLEDAPKPERPAAPSKHAPKSTPKPAPASKRPATAPGPQPPPKKRP